MAVPVVVFAYNRKDMLEKTLTELEKNDMAPQTDIIVFSDGAKGERDRVAVSAVQAYLTEWKGNNRFQSTQLFLRDRNQGVASSVIDGVTKVLAQHNSVIVVEDDLVTSPDFLTYMNQALRHYEKDARVWSISGYVPNLDILKTYPHDVFLYPRACSWGWATWRNRWEMVDWTVADYETLAGDKEQIRKFNRGGHDLFNMLKKQKRGKIDSWAIRWCYAQSKAEMYCVYPVGSKVQNIGCNDGTHFHGGYDNRYDTVPHMGQCDFSFCEVDSELERAFRSIYTVPLLTKVKRRIKSMVRKMGLYKCIKRSRHQG